jgi:hypothetical protein
LDARINKGHRNAVIPHGYGLEKAARLAFAARGPPKKNSEQVTQRSVVAIR